MALKIYLALTSVKIYDIRCCRITCKNLWCYAVLQLGITISRIHDLVCMEGEFNSKTGTLVTENFNFLYSKEQNLFWIH